VYVEKFTIGIALPVELLEFNAVAINDQNVKTTWVTASETNNDYFSVQRSINGVDFEEIGTVLGAGNSTTTIYYPFHDYAPYRGVSYYRLTQYDFDGSFTHSAIRSVYIDPINIINVFPNPTESLVNVVVGAAENMQISIVVYNGLGERVIVSKNTILKGEQTIGLNVSGLSTGNYLFQITTPLGDQVESEFIKN